MAFVGAIISSLRIFLAADSESFICESYNYSKNPNTKKFDNNISITTSSSEMKNHTSKTTLIVEEDIYNESGEKDTINVMNCSNKTSHEVKPSSNLINPIFPSNQVQETNPSIPINSTENITSTKSLYKLINERPSNLDKLNNWLKYIDEFESEYHPPTTHYA